MHHYNNTFRAYCSLCASFAILFRRRLPPPCPHWTTGLGRMTWCWKVWPKSKTLAILQDILPRWLWRFDCLHLHCLHLVYSIYFCLPGVNASEIGSTRVRWLLHALAPTQFWGWSSFDGAVLPSGNTDSAAFVWHSCWRHYGVTAGYQFILSKRQVRILLIFHQSRSID